MTTETGFIDRKKVEYDTVRKMILGNLTEQEWIDKEAKSYLEQKEASSMEEARLFAVLNLDMQCTHEYELMNMDWSKL